VLSEEFVAAVEKAFSVEGFDLKVDFGDVEVWDEAIFFTRSLISEKGYNYVSYYRTFRINFALIFSFSKQCTAHGVSRCSDYALNIN